ncbi:MAG: nitroreductase family protein [Verrucomicrobiota bacterium]|nr:nitroreductase family protein [Verrucomicrobiota bacterium]
MPPRFIPLPRREAFPDEAIRARAAAFYAQMSVRRTVRDFSSLPIRREVIEDCIRAAGTAPSGANMQPWHFVAVSDAVIKRQIRLGAEREEQEFYSRRASAEWLNALAALGTNANKPFLEAAPWLIAIFSQPYGLTADGARIRHYYATESVGIATGFLVAALHHAGLVSLTHTPSPMGFLNELLDRPRQEKPFLLLVVGHPVEDALVPDITRKSLGEISSFVA